MANNLGQVPWVIDTAAATILWTGKVSIAHIEFVGYTVDTDKAIIKNAQGLVICQLDGSSDLQAVKSGKIGWVSGIAVTQIDGGGVVRIYIE